MDERIDLSKESDLYTATLRCRDFALRAGLDQVRAQKLATAASELTRNVHKYAGGFGTVRLSLNHDAERTWLELEVSDCGPGITDLESAMRDHYSTSGTLGLGLPGVKRLVDDFTITSSPGQGTRVLVRMQCRPT